MAERGFLGNDATETTLEESTSLEQYLTQAIVVAVELNPLVLEPEAEPEVKLGVSAPEGEVRPSDVAELPRGHRRTSRFHVALRC